MIIRAQSPCKDCEDRELGCHGHCPRYQAYQQENNAWHKAKELEQSIKCYKHTNIWYDGSKRKWPKNYGK